MTGEDSTESKDVLSSFWGSLRFFSIYRLVIAVLFLAVVLLFGDALGLGTQDIGLFRKASAIYVLLSVALLVAALKRPSVFDLQLSIQVTVDIVALTMMMYASGGQKSGIAVLLLVVVAGAGLVGQGRMTLFYAATASVAMLLEEAWRVLTLDADPGDFARTGIICISFFGVAIVARLLAQRVVANENLAHERGKQLSDQLRISERIIRDMDDGVLVVDGSARVRLFNPSAEAMLDVQLGDQPALKQLSELLAVRYAVWSVQHIEVAEILRPVIGKLLRVRYLPPAELGGNGLIYLEDIDPLRKRLARIIHDNTKRLNRLVTDVLELGRRDRAQPELIRWSSFITSFLEELALHDPSTTTRLKLNGDDFNLRFDRGHLYRVLWNILVNALRHAGTGTGSIQIRTTLTSTRDRAELHITDNGAGVDPALRAQVFEPFFTTHGSGTGLGLYIARELCEASGAQLDLLDSETGAHFRIVVEGEPCR